MSDATEDLVKVRVPTGPPFAPDTPELLWAVPAAEADCYEIRNTPWDAYGLNWGDVVRAVPATDGDVADVLEVVRPSGHRTLRVIFNVEVLEPHHVQTILDELDGLDANHENQDSRLYGIDVRPTADYDAVCDVLVGHHDDGRLIFEEAWRGPSDDEQDAPSWL